MQFISCSKKAPATHRFEKQRLSNNEVQLKITDWYLGESQI